MSQQPLPNRRRIRAVRREVEPKSGRDRGIVWAAVAALILALAIPGITVWRLYPPAGTDTVALASGTLEVSREVDALLVRREQVYKAPVAGAVRRLAEEGRRIQAGTPVVELATAGFAQAGGGPSAVVGAPQPPVAAPAPAPLTPSDPDAALAELGRQLYRAAADLNRAIGLGNRDEAVRLQNLLDTLAARQWVLARQTGAGGSADQSAPPGPAAGTGSQAAPSGAPQLAADSAGILVYQTDGLESALDPGNIGTWKPSWYKALPAPSPDRLAVGNAAPGDAVFKVADSLSLGILTVVPASGIPHLDEGDRVQVRIGGEADRTVTARLTRQVREGDDLLLYLTASAFSEDLALLRKVRATLVFAIYDGKIAPRTAVDVRAGVQGVWVKTGKEEHFKPVTVLGGNATDVSLETDLQPGTRILRVAPQRMQQ